MAPERTPSDRLALRATAIGALIWALTGIATLLARDAGPDTSLLVGYLVFLFWLYPGTLAHLVLLAYALWRAARGRAGAIAIVYPYLAATIALYAIAAFHFGAGEVLGDAATLLKRQVVESEQLELEVILRERATDADAVRDALAAGADPHRPVPPMGMAPVLVAANRGAAETVRVLVEAGADPDARSPIRWSGSRFEMAAPRPLDLAALVRDPQRRRATVEALVAAGADPRRSALLTISCMHGDAALYERARELRAPDVADGDGRTCLHHTAAGGHRELFLTHLPRSADVDTNAAQGGTPLDLALGHEAWAIARVLLERGASATNEHRARAALRRPAGADADLAAVQALIARRWPGLGGP